tara:strand:- start:141 stop:2075 length:1935 start_codon:yes stop_codon:yes gene_type:complete
MSILKYIAKNLLIKRLILILIDLFLILFSFWLSFVIRLGEIDWLQISDHKIEYTLIIAFAYIIYFSLAFLYGLYNIVIRYIGLSTIYLISKIVIIFTLIWGGIIIYLSIPGFPRSIIIIYPTIIAILFYFSRLVLQSIAINTLYNIDFSNKNLRKNKIVIYGAGDSGTQLANALTQSNRYEVINFIDDAKEKIGRNIYGIGIINFKSFINGVNLKSLDEIYLALPRITKKQRTAIITKLSSLNIRIKSLPPLNDILMGDLNNIEAQNLDIEDLLERNTDDINDDVYEKILFNKCILITGAGGSIGSELCRQIILKKPKIMVLLDISEFAIYNIQQEFNDILSKFPKLSLNTKIIYSVGSIQDYQTIDTIINKFKPNIIYHAAAYKHVPIVESNVHEGFKNNVLGTLNVAILATKYKVDDFVLISSDKAVRPTNIMGYTKRIAELVLQGIVNENSIEIKDYENKSQNYKQDTNFSIVRFGNVFESSGSVVPLFKKQIQNGGPITITHKDITRYFMTTKEASLLVIIAGSFKKKLNPASIYLLDMGQPVKIIDLAKKIIIQNGFTIKNNENANGDIEIKTIGLRPGEKLHEELLISGNPEKTHYEKIYKSYEPFKTWEILSKEINELANAKYSEDDLIYRLKKIID